MRPTGRRRAGRTARSSTRPGFAVAARTGLGQTLISGDLEAALEALAPGAPLLGLYGLAPDSAHALRIARDQALLVTPAPLGVAEGWRDGWCATAVDDGWACVDVEGARRAARADAGNLGRPRRGLALGRRPVRRPARACWRARTPASGCMSRPHGSRL